MPTSSRIEGIGRPRVEPSFLPGVVDQMVSVPDAASIAAARHVSAQGLDPSGPAEALVEFERSCAWG